MKHHCIALLGPNETVEDVKSRRARMAGFGVRLAGVVDPLQREKVTVVDGTFIANSLPIATQVCRTSEVCYGFTVMQVSDILDKKCQTYVS